MGACGLLSAELVDGTLVHFNNAVLKGKGPQVPSLLASFSQSENNQRRDEGSPKFKKGAGLN